MGEAGSDGWGQVTCARVSLARRKNASAAKIRIQRETEKRLVSALARSNARGLLGLLWGGGA